MYFICIKFAMNRWLARIRLQLYLASYSLIQLSLFIKNALTKNLKLCLLRVVVFTNCRFSSWQLRRRTRSPPPVEPIEGPQVIIRFKLITAMAAYVSCRNRHDLYACNSLNKQTKTLCVVVWSHSKIVISSYIFFLFFFSN